jgi:hypothetical protein
LFVDRAKATTVRDLVDGNTVVTTGVPKGRRVVA